MNDPNNWYEILKRAKKIQRIENEDNEKYIVKYKDKAGKPIDSIPKAKSPLVINRGFCINCAHKIKQSTADDRYCRDCFRELFGKKGD